ncbi:MAG: PspA/IM30 family protein [Myxococcales bacterium]|nr:PspA/IM30 family protein [Myxococcota bacterium]MDW8283295.1 PspA/IM30 family protein [Myxococcales bacterium]
MKLLDRLSQLVRSNLNAALDSLSDPGKEVDLLIEQMEEALRRSRLELRDQLAQEKLAHKRAEEAYRNVLRWQEHAERAARAGDEELARTALQRQAEAEQQQEEAERLHAEQSRLVAQLTQRIRDNDRKLAEIKARKGMLKARARAAKQLLAAEGTALDRFDELVQQIELNEQQAEAMAEMARDPDLALRPQSRDEAIGAKFARSLGGSLGSRDEEIEQRLRALKARLDKRDEEP